MYVQVSECGSSAVVGLYVKLPSLGELCNSFLVWELHSGSAVRKVPEFGELYSSSVVRKASESWGHTIVVVVF